MTAINQEDFPILKNDRILKVIKGEKPDKLPIWVMRQAGRYMPKFREFRKLHTFFEICQTPELACEVTLMPIERFDLDAAIIFSDILVVPQALGLEVEMKESVGPVIKDPVIIENLKNLNSEGAANRLNYVGKAITLTRKKLNGKVPLIGFSGAPWTLMGYMIEGGGSKTYSRSKRWLYSHETEAHQLLTILTNVIIDYLILQVKAGAQLLQVFESSAEFLNEYLFDTFCMPYLRRIVSEVKTKIVELNLNIPMILFAKGSHYSLEKQKSLGYDVMGIDWTISPKTVRQILGDQVVQGNLDPCALYSSPDRIKDHVEEMIKGFGTRNLVVNLGHGIYPDMSEEAVESFINAVHNVKL
ncbi:methyltetrahydrofolate:homocysteine methyltransferase related [Holotrichia oblita]|uniref:Methyltetrahydrofolate:homocysteine methyltransferase related n=1 Tax=Holotrichia oblita TaxID=644536 RepID=A0ACB9SHJ3_HOLOL|nr:methyltetrahydrofolate:homocysteine methyltransferase related [Holotrichia oblita]